MTIDQYEARFAELSKYAPRLVEDPMDRSKRFRDGLKPEIRSVLIRFILKDYNDPYERAQMVEQDPTERAATSGSRFAPSNRRDIWQGKRPMQSNRFNIPPNRRGVISKPMPRKDNVCHLCNQRHGYAPCRMRGACFGCGQQGHLVRDYPQRQQARPPGGQVGRIAPPNYRNGPRAQRRVFAITRDEAKDSPIVIGTVLPQNSVAYALFDPGATYSFVADQFVRLSGLIVVPLDVVVKVSTPLKDSVIATVGSPGCKLVVDGHESEIDLVVLEIFEFVGNRGGTSTVVISLLEATRLLANGCQGYLAAVVDTSIGETKLEEIAVVCEFPNVFPEELPGLPPKREIEVVIDLALGTEPISKAPYKMALSELKELKVQKQELLDK
ncbi:uncharacterized protein LOC115727423 [Rhodamnia argentea]|uniref:Uncharacterized protein LOC115727423 n=1 Tax=Rhodamnia argentea TaxID=178133 RepID=A0ABM3H6L0_9MYRT|nr:uncharacterized protein LOC115727423 [Rhodamnia argentea]